MFTSHTTSKTDIGKVKLIIVKSYYTNITKKVNPIYDPIIHPVIDPSRYYDKVRARKGVRQEGMIYVNQYFRGKHECVCVDTTKLSYIDERE